MFCVCWVTPIYDTSRGVKFDINLIENRCEKHFLVVVTTEIKKDILQWRVFS